MIAASDSTSTSIASDRARIAGKPFVLIQQPNGGVSLFYDIDAPHPATDEERLELRDHARRVWAVRAEGETRIEL